MIQKVKGGYVIVHCHNGRTGRIAATKKPVPYWKAAAILGAIQRRRAGTYRKGFVSSRGRRNRSRARAMARRSA